MGKKTKLTIKGDGFLMRHLEVSVNGTPIPGLKALNLSLDVERVNTATITFRVDELDADLEALLKLQRRDRPEPPQGYRPPTRP
jgi:hypothetical protein